VDTSPIWARQRSAGYWDFILDHPLEDE